MQGMNLLNLLVMAVTVWLCVRIPGLHEAFGFGEVNYGFAYILLGAGLGIVQPLTGLFMNGYSRRAEFRADHEAVKENYGSALCTALKILARENFAHLAPAKLLVKLEYSHPPMDARVREVEKAMSERNQ
jgi:STE24 endopeptidase